MKFLNTAALAFLASTAQGCMQFGARINGDGQILGAIVDNGQTTCQINVNLNNPGPDNQYWCSNCQSGFACWVSRDLGTLAYANGGNNYRFAIQRNGQNLAVNAFC